MKAGDLIDREGEWCIECGAYQDYMMSCRKCGETVCDEHFLGHFAGHQMSTDAKYPGWDVQETPVGLRLSRENVVLWRGDNRQILPTFADKKFDHCVTDPPYGIGEAKGKNATRTNLAQARDYGCLDWDDEPPTADDIRQLMRIAREQVLFGGNYFELPPTSSWIVWDKDNSGDFADCELAWTSHKRAIRKVRWRWNGMLQENMRNKDIRIHPTQKPLGVMLWVIQNYTAPGETVIDPYGGSFTTVEACIKLDRPCTAIERESAYFDEAVRRITAALLAEKSSLFKHEPRETQATLFTEE